MQNLIYTGAPPISQRPTCSPAVIGPTVQCVASNVHGSPEPVRMENTDLCNDNGTGGQDAIQDAGQDPSHAANNPTTPNEQTHKYGGILYLLYSGALVVLFPSLAQLAQLKFQKQSPFQTHSFFAYMAVISMTISIPISMILFALDSHLLKISSTKRAHLYVYNTLKGVFYFSVILAPFSLVLILVIPHEFIWIGYSLLFVLCILILASNFLDYKVIPGKLERCASKFGTVQSNDQIELHVVISK